MPEAVTQPGTTSLACRELLACLDPLLRGWLPRQRWFAGKGRPVTGFFPVSSTELLPVPPMPAPGPGGPPGLIHLLVHAAQGTAAGGGWGNPPRGDCYQLLLGVRETLPPHLAPALIGRVTGGPLAGRTVYEALYDPLLAEVLLQALRHRARIGSLRFERDAHTEIGHGLPPRMLGAEQSNSSLIYGDTFILKLFRRIVPGINPDLELPHALARTACPRVPPPAAWLVADAQGADTQGRTGGPGVQVPAGAGCLASSGAGRYAPAAGLSPASYPAGRTEHRTGGTPDTVELTAPETPAHPAPDPAQGHRPPAAVRPPQDTLVLGVLQPYLKGATDGWQLALSELAAGEDFRAEARALGRATAEVHTALAGALPTVTLGRAQMERLATGMTERLDAAVQAVPALRPYASGLRSAYDALASLGARDRRWLAQRVHGDLHLGQACGRPPASGH